MNFIFVPNENPLSLKLKSEEIHFHLSSRLSNKSQFFSAFPELMCIKVGAHLSTAHFLEEHLTTNHALPNYGKNRLL
jgi:hypothetical protein